MESVTINIDNAHDLLERIDEYKRLFPDSYTGMAEIQRRLKNRANDPMGLVFGIEISSEWKDKCFGFEVDRVTPTTTYFRYLGIYKC